MKSETDNIKYYLEFKWAPPIWSFGWLFTIGYVNLNFIQAILAIIIWPYYLGKIFIH